ncbi:MAG TPA: GNAT family N-acetyltransferase [Bryobacteraceae bacterium]|nr:GNAT family N-acetyltransferase [Bryobacteraceae bacterium]
MDYSVVADNLRESFRVLAAGRCRGDVRELRGVSIASAGVTFQMFNAAFLSGHVQSESDLAQRILLAALHFEQRAEEWAYWVCEDWMDSRTRKRSRKLFDQHGLRHSVDLPGMIAGRLRPPVRPLPRLEIRRVADARTREAFCAIGSACFNVPLSWFREVFEQESVWSRFRGYVGYHDEEPVSTVAVVVNSGVAGVYNVATLPGSQRRGYGEAVMRYALEEAHRQSGVETTILQSTPAGYHLYERMGYRTVTSVAVYST